MGGSSRTSAVGRWTERARRADDQAQRRRRPTADLQAIQSIGLGPAPAATQGEDMDEQQKAGEGSSGQRTPVGQVLSGALWDAYQEGMRATMETGPAPLDAELVPSAGR